MNESHFYRPRIREGVISAVAAGFFFILIGAIFVMTPNLFHSIETFFRNFDTIKVPNTAIYLPAPRNPDLHTDVYAAAGTFCLVWGIFQIVLLGLRFATSSPYGKKAETVQHMVYWLGAYYLVVTFLNDTTTVKDWFVFWAMIIAWCGFSLIVRGIILAARRLA
jgi:hypothetical protein